MTAQNLDPTAGDIKVAFSGYLAASISLDAERVADYYDVPFLLVTAGGPMPLAGRAEVVAYLESSFQGLRESDYARTDFPTLAFRSLGAGLAVVSGVGVRQNTAGEPMISFGLTYLWRFADGSWKLTVMTVHDPSATLLADKPD